MISFPPKSNMKPDSFQLSPKQQKRRASMTLTGSTIGKIISLCQVQKLILCARIFFQFSNAAYFKRFVVPKIKFFISNGDCKFVNMPGILQDVEHFGTKILSPLEYKGPKMRSLKNTS